MCFARWETEEPSNDRAVGMCGDNFGIGAEFQEGFGNEDGQGSLTSLPGNTEPKNQGGKAKFY